MPPVARGYGRISTSEDRQMYSPASQERQCKEAWEKHPLASKLQWEGFFFDSEVSGGVPLCERKAGRELNLRLNKGDYLFIARADRAFRSIKDQVITYEAWSARGVNISFLDIGTDVATPQGELTFNIMGSVARYERRIIGQRICDGMYEKKRRGLPVTREAPIGWKIVGKEENARYEPFEYERELCELIFNMRFVEKKRWWEVRTYFLNNVPILDRHKRGAPQNCIRARKGPWSFEWLERAARAHRRGYPCPIAARREAYLASTAPEPLLT